MSIVVVGSIALDTVRTAERTVEEVLGGSASYFALAARHFTEVDIVAVVGEDFPPAELRRFERPGIRREGLATLPGRTFRWTGEYSRDLNQRKTLNTELNVFADFHPVLTPEQRRAETVFLANIDPDLQIEVFEQMEAPKLVACDTMDLWIRTKREPLLELLRRVDLCLLSDEEARLLTGEIHLPRAARKLLDLGLRQAVIKKGEHGALFVSPRERFFCPAYPVEALVDPTGAGDTFAGGLLGYLDHRDARRPPLRAGMVCGAAMASLCVESFGPERLCQTGRDEIAERVEEVRGLIRVPRVPLWQTAGAGDAQR